MSEIKSVWCLRVLQMVKEFHSIFGAKAATKGEFITELKKQYPDDQIPSIFSKGESRTKRKWYKQERLLLFIKLVELLGLFDLEKEETEGEEKNLFSSSEVVRKKEKETIFISESGKKLLDVDKRGGILMEACIKALDYFHVKISDIVNTFDQIKSPTTAEIIIQVLDPPLGLSSNELTLFEAILKIYGDFSSELDWSGKTSFGVPFSLSRTQITPEDESILNYIVQKASTYNERDNFLSGAVTFGPLTHHKKEAYVEYLKKGWAQKRNEERESIKREKEEKLQKQFEKKLKQKINH